MTLPVKVKTFDSSIRRSRPLAIILGRCRSCACRWTITLCTAGSFCLSAHSPIRIFPQCLSFMHRRRLLSVRMLSRVFFRAVIGIETSFSAGYTAHRTGMHAGEKTKRRTHLQYGAPLLKTQKFWRFFRRIASSIRLIKRKCPCKLNIPS